jgi:beta-N-acetylhexosaminidase
MRYQDLSASQRAGQRLMVGFEGLTLDDTLKFYIERLKVGGLILFSRNIASADQIESLCTSVQAYASQCGQPPLFIGIDQEGGMVARLKPPFTQFRGNAYIQSPEDAMAFARTTGRELKQIGVNMNMAPVLDVLPPAGPSVMLGRAFGRDPQRVAELGATVIHHLQEQKIMAVGKHFPGIGRTVLDSHEDLPDLDIDAATLAAGDLLPFQTAIDCGVAAIMLSHIRYLGIDPNWPASLSAAVAEKLLRRQLAFQGVVITDDLDMGAIAKHYTLPVIVERALQAAVDILLICHAGPKIQAAFDHILALGKSDAIIARLEDDSLERILSLKQRYLAA